ncbi:hypothetical protein CC80DRAFT_415320 [Byssothecium circinans]|uniref:Rhodopsin domain-containing protein n=1 Tax=Byssothecium circinans TaxID=147558 RepID=A0A6A5TV44_9PLEO|nr:hypothetical protein CC80DRAFT_415320 [Byssothecium circinans]
MLMATQSPSMVVLVTAVMLFLDFVAVILRFLSRRIRIQRCKADDWLCLAALVWLPVKRTALTTSNEQVILVAKLQYIFVVISIPTLGFIKLSVLCLYRRIFVTDTTNVQNLHNMLYIFLLSLTAIWATGFCLAFMFACRGHFSAWWTSAISLITNCVNTLELLFSFAISDFLTDAIVILLPIPLVIADQWEQILKLHLPMRKKLAVLMMFLLGTLAMASSLIRMIWVIWARKAGFDISLDQNREYLDPFLSGFHFCILKQLHIHSTVMLILLVVLITTMLFWSMLEINLGIVAICLPTLRPIFQHKSVESVINSVRGRVSIKSRSNETLRSGYVRQHDVAQDVYPLVELEDPSRLENAAKERV